MPKLSIKYQASDRRAVLYCDDEDAWANIRRVCLDHSDEVELLSVQSLSLPWWQLLSCREAIGYHVAASNLELELEADAAQLLQKALDKREAFQKPSSPASITELRKALKDRGFDRELTAEQERNVAQLMVSPAGATFSVPGAGKTSEALAIFFLKAANAARLLVIAPKNAFASWERELALCVPSSTRGFVRLTGGEARIRAVLQSDPQFMLVTYQQFQFARDAIAPLIVDATWVFLDESHRIKKGLDGKIANTVLSISHLPDFKLILSGTPMPNSTADLVPQFAFLFPEVPVSPESVTDAIKPFYVRTTKSELGLLEPKRRLIPIVMTEPQRRLYRLASSEVARQAELALQDRFKMRALGRSVIRLLQVASNPILVARNGNLPSEVLLDLLSSEEDSPKIQFACDTARDLAQQGKKVVIWSAFVENVELIAMRLADLGAEYIHGGIDAGSEEEEDTREWKIKNFHAPGRNWVLVANPAACGEGISLHKICHHAIYVDRNYNAAQYLQSEDRIHRLGMDKQQETIIDILSCSGSIDESVNERLIAKARRMAEVLNDEDLHIDPVSFDPAAIEDSETLDEEDVSSLLKHLREEERTG